MSDQTERLAAIQARATNCRTYNFGMRAADKLAHEDVWVLLDLVRKYQMAMARVEVACDAMDAGTAIRSGDPQTKSFAAQAIRAVIREELEGKP